jgi:phosphatidylserine/phosphatidylglycerophosphate/cardiolipin synthase-like enzyme
VVVVDDAKVFIGSANFTEAAQERNIEVGVVIQSKSLADQLHKHFASMVAEDTLRAVFNSANWKGAIISRVAFAPSC